MAPLTQRPGSWTSYVGAQGSSENVPASNMEAARPCVAWPWKSHGIASIIVTRTLPRGRRQRLTTQWKKHQKSGAMF